MTAKYADVVEIALTQDVVANAAALSSALTSTGHGVVNGILFDTGKAEVKPESAPALEEAAGAELALGEASRWFEWPDLEALGHSFSRDECHCQQHG